MSALGAKQTDDRKGRTRGKSISPYYLRIEKEDKVAVPKKYHPVINTSAVVYDQLRSCLTEPSFAPFRNWSYHFKPGEQARYAQSGLHLLEWLKSIGARAELEECLVKHVTLSVLTDLMEFIFESMNSMKYGRASASFSLLRKPFVDSLAILEEILLDPTDFVDRFFHNGEITTYDPSKRNRVHAKGRILAVREKLKMGLLFDPDILHRMRYDKATGVSVDSYANRALHIVTDDPRYRTAKGNLNFVFSVDEDRLRYFGDYYLVVPFLLCYMAEVVDCILERYVEEPAIMAVRRFQRTLVIDRWTALTVTQGPTSRRRSLLRVISKGVSVTCERCGKVNGLHRTDCIFILEQDYWICAGCFGNLLRQKIAQSAIEQFLAAFKLVQSDMPSEPSPSS